jgi:hypothetical protein
MNADEIVRLDGRIDDLQNELRRLVESPVFDQKMAELEYRLDQFAARLREVEHHTEAQRPSRPQKTRR